MFLKKCLGGMVIALAGLSMAQAADLKKVDVTAIVEHPALDAIHKGVVEGLKQAGYEEGKTVKVRYQSAQGNTSTAAQIARQFVGENPDVIVAIGTPSAQAVAAATKKIPLVFSAVTDPVAAQLVKSEAASGTNITGASDRLDLKSQIELIKEIAPNAKTLGMVYNPGEANSAATVKQFKEVLPQYGMTLIEAAAPRTVDVSSAARKLVGKVDVVYSNNDNNVSAAYETLAKVLNEAKVPLVASDPANVKRGAVASYGTDYESLGLETSKIVLEILNGKDPGTIPYHLTQNQVLILNQKAAKKQGVTFSQKLLDSAKTIIE
ncbi:ABC transporter substrate-binding protein [Brackiella oedipodis]|uniref:ABC transporter substrate-binding protein n=1 Tax=Brackiella oedipodis TaxID=124225 RepID=UPI0004915BCE